jgi:hypothetical protein
VYNASISLIVITHSGIVISVFGIVITEPGAWSERSDVGRWL